MMQVGVVFPQLEIGADRIVIRDYAQAIEALGYDHLVAAEHVLGADKTNRPGWRAYDIHDMFHEPFILFGYIAACTVRIGLGTCVLVLPQRQTALVAKQAAELDVLSGGRIRLGIGVGWNAVEYKALGAEFQTRGARTAEQIRVLRALWTERNVTVRGRRHTIIEAGLNPLPIQRPIPIWVGGDSEAALRRAGTLGDGWMPGLGSYSPAVASDDGRRKLVDRLRSIAKAAGRDPLSIGIEARVSIASREPDDWRRAVNEWRGLGATHVSVMTYGAGLRDMNEHVTMARRFLDAVRG
jgi:probable F420-dependent oxidoreductase